MKNKIAVLGSTSHIAKGLIKNFLEDGRFDLHLYARSPNKIVGFLSNIGKSSDNNCIIHEGYNNFLISSYDVIINCVGVGTLNKPGNDYSSYFTVTEKYDNLIIEYLIGNPETLYISFSSGAVYGREHSAPVVKNTTNEIHVNKVTPADYYAIARLNSEAKHRSFNNLKIIDLRIFSYFSRFIDLTDGYFITEVINSILNQKVLVTNNVNIIRDYVHPKDLFSIIKICMDAGMLNTTLDVSSTRPVEKKEILDYFSLEYGLKYEIGQSIDHTSPTGLKEIYYSNNKGAANIGYKPEFSSMDTIKQESEYILNTQSCSGTVFQASSL